MPKRKDASWAIFYTYDNRTGAPITGESAATMNVYISRDGGEFSRISSPGIQAVDASNLPGFYRLALTSNETDANHILLRFASSTANTAIDACEKYFETYAVAADIPEIPSISSPPSAAQIADAVLTRSVTHVESAAPLHCLCTIILAHLESRVTENKWLIHRTDGSTQHAALEVSTSADAEAVTGVNS